MINTENCRSKIIQLLKIFKEEAKYLRSGKLLEVTALTSAKTSAVSDVEAAFNSIENINTDAQLKPYLQALHKVSQENARLLQAAIAGAQAAKSRLNGLQLAHAEIGTYNEAGRKHRLTSSHISSKITV